MYLKKRKKNVFKWGLHLLCFSLGKSYVFLLKLSLLQVVGTGFYKLILWLEMGCRCERPQSLFLPQGPVTSVLFVLPQLCVGSVSGKGTRFPEQCVCESRESPCSSRPPVRRADTLKPFRYVHNLSYNFPAAPSISLLLCGVKKDLWLHTNKKGLEKKKKKERFDENFWGAGA